MQDVKWCDLDALEEDFRLKDSLRLFHSQFLD